MKGVLKAKMMFHFRVSFLVKKRHKNGFFCFTEMGQKTLWVSVFSGNENRFWSKSSKDSKFLLTHLERGWAVECENST